MKPLLHPPPARTQPIGNLLLVSAIMQHPAAVPEGINLRQEHARIPPDIRQRSHVVTTSRGALLCGFLRAGDTTAEHLIAVSHVQSIPHVMSRWDPVLRNWEAQLKAKP